MTVSFSAYQYQYKFHKFINEKLYNFKKRTEKIVISPNGKILASYHANGEIRLWTLKLWSGLIRSGESLQTLKSCLRHPILFSSDSTKLIFIEVDDKLCKTFVNQFDLTDQTETKAYIKELDYLDSIYFTVKDEIIVFTSGSDYGLKKWNIPTGDLLYHSTDCFSLNIHGFVSSKGKCLLMCDDRNEDLVFCDPSTGKVLNTLKIVKDKSFEGGLHTAVSSDGKILTVASGVQIQVWDLDYMEQLYTLRRTENGYFANAHRDFIYSVACSPENYILASAGNEPIIRIWDLNTGKEIYSMTDPALDSYSISILFTSNGKNLITGGADGRIRIWNY